MTTPSSKPPRSDKVRPSETASDRAPELRQDQTMPEAILWKHLRGRRLDGLKFRRQHPLGPFVADFYCHDAGLVVEIDSAAHDGRLDRDAARDAWMQMRGVDVLRVRAVDVNQSLEGVLLAVRQRAQDRIAAIERGRREEKK